MSATAGAHAALFASMAGEAGAAIMAVRAAGATARRKPDRSLVCEADEHAEAVLTAAVEKAFPGMAIVAEERVAKYGPPEVGEDFVLIDALDGTNGFLKGGDQFTVNLALVRERRAVEGFVYAPALDALYVGGPEGAFHASLRPGEATGSLDYAAMRTRPYPGDEVTAVVSRSHLDDATMRYLKAAGFRHRQVSSALKFCVVARGDADLYPRFVGTCEWDTAAGQAVLEAAGGVMLGLDGAPFRYGKPKFENNGFLAWGGRPLTAADGVRL